MDGTTMMETILRIEEFLVEIRSQDARTYGPYIFMVHGGVAYPQEPDT